MNARSGVPPEAWRRVRAAGVPGAVEDIPTEHGRRLLVFGWSCGGWCSGGVAAAGVYGSDFYRVEVRSVPGLVFLFWLLVFLFWLLVFLFWLLVFS